MGDIKEAIKSVLTGAYSEKDLDKMGMSEGKPASSFKIVYDAPTSQLEPVYFWLLDFVQGLGMDVEKTTDNFMSSPGSGHFAEIGARATRMQDEGSKMLGAINQVTKSILNLIYDLKEFEIRLEHYDDAKSDDDKIKEQGLLALKQIWLDNVDLKRGRGSIHQMSYEMGFTTLRESFMIADSIEELKKNEIINDQVKRILVPRFSEFEKWKEKSEQELRKRFKIERSYLKSQVETLKLYTKWARPYLKAVEGLRQKGFEGDPALVNAFNTAMFELVLFGKKKNSKLPEGVKYNLKKDYYSCVVISLNFRGMPQKVTQQHYGFGGKVEIVFDSYALNDKELELIEKKKGEQDLEDGLSFLAENTEDTLNELKEDLDKLLGDDEKKEEKKKEEKKQDDINPFSALVGLFKSDKKKKDDKVEKVGDLKKDNWVEDLVRKNARDSAKGSLYTIYDVYKKSHGMPSSPEDFEN